jgi:hypothetical protein
MGFNLHIVGNEAWSSLSGNFMSDQCSRPVICIVGIEQGQHCAGVPEHSVFHRSTIDIENSVLVPGARFLAAPAPGSDQMENRVVLGKRWYLIAAHCSCTLL